MKLNKYIDHTKLGPTVTLEDIKKLLDEAKKYDFKSVCVDPIYVKYAKETLKDTDVLICTVVGFPAGTHSASVKVLETKQAIKDGADEIDMVINQNAMLNGNYDIVLDEIKKIKKACKGRLLKVIIETCNLTKELKVKACELAKEAGADFVKTSTGFAKGGATAEDIKLMRKIVGKEMGVKASGGVRTYEDAMNMIKAGATRIGTSSGIAIVTQKGSSKNDPNTSY